MRLHEDALGAHPNSGCGELVQFPAPHDAPNDVIAAYQDALTDWSYGPLDLASSVRTIRAWSHSLVGRFFPSVRAPEFLLRFERESARVLGHYVPGRNDAGLRWEISINPRHLGVRSERETAAVLLHELLHWYEELTRPAQRSRNGYHSAFFRGFAERVGIPCTRYGAESGIVSPSPFASWADEHGLRADGTPVALPPLPPDVTKRVSWVCECPAGIVVTVQVPRGSELRAHCDACRAPFRRKGDL